MTDTFKQPWYAYILLCNDGTLYTGITIDPEKRLKTHQSGKGAKYTKHRGAKHILFSEKFANHHAAAVRETILKKLIR